LIADRPVRSLKDKIRALTSRLSQQPPRAVLIRLNQIMRSWSHYFRHAVAKHTMSSLENSVWHRVIRWWKTVHRWRWKDVRRHHTAPTGQWARPSVDGIELFNGDGRRGRAPGDTLASEYWRDRDATLESFRNGWFRTGDLGEESPDDGRQRVVGRKKDVIITGGENVMAREVEDVLHEHPVIARCRCGRRRGRVLGRGGLRIRRCARWLPRDGRRRYAT
jgi:hypothetical protein